MQASTRFSVPHRVTKARAPNPQGVPGVRRWTSVDAVKSVGWTLMRLVGDRLESTVDVGRA